MLNIHQLPGFFFSFEGIEAAGKTTQIQLATQALQRRGQSVLCLREPGGTDFGEQLRNCLLHPNGQPPSALAQALTFIAARAELLEKKIIPWLSRPNHVVLLDRYLDSTLAYQGMGQGPDEKDILDLHKVGPLGLRPQRTFYVKISWTECQLRMKARGAAADFFEGQDASFHQNLIKAFDHLAKKNPERIVVIDGMGTQEQVSQAIFGEIEQCLNNPRS